MHTARFPVGASVKVLDLGKAGHVRVPFYVRHKVGRVVQLCGYYLNPEDLAAGVTGRPVIPLYRVEFRQHDLWPDYAGPENDRLVIEIYDHWLATTKARRRSNRPARERRGVIPAGQAISLDASPHPD